MVPMVEWVGIVTLSLFQKTGCLECGVISIIMVHIITIIGMV